MEIKIKCPWCNQEYSIDESLNGQKVECSVCEKEFVARKPNASVAVAKTKTIDSYLKKKKNNNKPNVSVNLKSRKRICLSKGIIKRGIIAFAALGIILIPICVVCCIKRVSDKEYKKGLMAFEAQRYEEASVFFQKAAKLGHQKAKEEYKKSLAEFYYSRGEKAYILHHFEEAVNFFQKAAEMGLAKGQLSLGVCYYNGNGIKKDDSEAVKWIRRAAEQDHREAQYKLGLCYLLGAGVTRQEKEAVYWLQKAAEQGHGEAMSALSDYYYSIKDFDRGLDWAYKAINPKPITPASSK